MCLYYEQHIVDLDPLPGGAGLFLDLLGLICCPFASVTSGLQVAQWAHCHNMSFVNASAPVCAQWGSPKC